MEARIMKALGIAGVAGALSLTFLIGTGAAASGSATAPTQPAKTAPVAALRVPGFQPTASSFVSPTWGVVLGTSRSLIGPYWGHYGYRAQLEVTADGGMHWYPMNAPPAWLANGWFAVPRVSSVLFANHNDGWVYGPATMWATRDGGRTWQQVALPGTIQTLAATGHNAYAVIQRGGSDQLYASPLGQNYWTQVGTWMRVHPWWWRYEPLTGNQLAVSGNSVWFASNTYVWTTTNGVHWSRYALRSPGMYYGQPYQLAGVAASSSRIVTFLWAAPTGMFHTGMKVMVSFNGGRTEWQTLTAPPSEGDVAGFVMAPGSYGLVSVAVVTPGLDQIYTSYNWGQSWNTYAIPGTGGGIAVNSLQYMSPTVGCLVTGSAATGIPGTLLWTSNAGYTWYPIEI
jgi:hypothetical protein